MEFLRIAVLTLTVLTLSAACNNDSTDGNSISPGDNINPSSVQGARGVRKMSIGARALAIASSAELFIVGEAMAEPDCDESFAGRTVYLLEKAAFQFCNGHTYQEISIRGPVGRNGENGKPGVMGEKGEPGTSGTNGTNGDSCSTHNIPGGIEINCGQTKSFLASPGSVIAYPTGVIGVVNSVSYPSGDIVYRDANNVVLGRVSDKERSFDTDTGQAIRVNHQNTALELFEVEKLYMSLDCSGVPSVASQWKFYVLKDSSNNSYYVANTEIMGTNVLSKSKMVMGLCSNTDTFVAQIHPLQSYTLAPEILNAVFPLNLHQLP